jgi:hypothetical protein
MEETDFIMTETMEFEYFFFQTKFARYISETPQFCGGINNRDRSYCSPTSYYSMTNNDDIDKFSEPTITSLINVSIYLKEKKC